ncbi:MAG: 3-deoxy-D-manno-octulosonic acid kinase [Pseudomonadota bacterium]|nr:3-deoxy-D-manno-octulosonic acid kinase [Pseudomonadota bacterium]
MTKDGGLRIATAGGALLVDPDAVDEDPRPVAKGVPGAELDTWFEPAFWASRGELIDVTGGRGAAWFIASASRQWALRHYRRGGFVARLSTDGYVWAGEARVRAFAEWRLLAELVRRGLPVPTPVAARYRRRGLLYRCDLITLRIADARPLSALLTLGPLQESAWREVGATVAKLHAAGADHADLNAHNILRDSAGTVSVIDFDRGRLRPPGPWRRANLSRLRRSLRKVTRDLPPDRFPAAAWDWLLAGYASAPRR